MKPYDSNFTVFPDPHAQETVAVIKHASPAPHPIPDKMNLHSMASHAKRLIDQMGGIEGILNSVKQVHHVVKQVQEVAPLIQLLWGSFRSGTDDHEPPHPTHTVRNKSKKHPTNPQRKRKKTGKHI